MKRIRTKQMMDYVDRYCVEIYTDDWKRLCEGSKDECEKTYNLLEDYTWGIEDSWRSNQYYDYCEDGEEENARD